MGISALALIASIPSPESGVVEIGPVPLHAYGLMLAIGVIVATAVAERRYERLGGERGTIGQIAVAVVVAGVIGARVYHLFTGYDWDEGGLTGTVEIWEGGLSIWGAVAGGAIAIVWIARRRHLDALVLLDAIAPAVALAQAIGRWGNWFNQELFGKPSDLPWAVEIDLEHRPEGYTQYETFHPTFLYESLWCLAVFFVLIGIERRWRLRRGQVFAAYVALYTFGRIWFEALRIDEATKIFGVRFNLFVSIALCVLGVVAFVWLGRREVPEPAAPVDLGPPSGSVEPDAPPEPVES